MDLPNLAQWDAGTELDEALLNDMSYALSFLLDPPEAEVHQTSAQSIPKDLTRATPITFNSVTKDNDGFWHDIPYMSSRLTIQTTGWYEIEYAVHWALNGDATPRVMGICLNGAVDAASILGYFEHIDTSGTPDVHASYDLFLNAGDYIQLGVMQNSGGSLSTASGITATNVTFLRVRWSSL